MFEIQTEAFGRFEQYILRNTITGESVCIIPAFGATINHLTLSKNNVLHELIDGCNSYDELITEGKNKFKGCKLYPYPNRIENGAYFFMSKQYQLPINFPLENNSIHGLVCEAEFTVTNAESYADRCLLALECETKGDEAGYPFLSKVEIIFTLDKKGFTAKTIITNTDDREIPVADGWHPYFKTGSKVDELYLTLPVTNSFEVNNTMIPTGKKNIQYEFTTSQKINTQLFDTGFEINNNLAIAETVLEDKNKNISLHIWQESANQQYKFLQIYTPPHRNSIAIEPMTALTNAFNNQMGLIVLGPKKNITTSFGVKLL